MRSSGKALPGRSGERQERDTVEGLLGRATPPHRQAEPERDSTVHKVLDTHTAFSRRSRHR